MALPKLSAFGTGFEELVVHSSYVFEVYEAIPLFSD